MTEEFLSATLLIERDNVFPELGDIVLTRTLGSDDGGVYHDSLGMSLDEARALMRALMRRFPLDALGQIADEDT